jgi:aspartate kinase
MVVLKFGGTSVEDATAMKTAAAIVCDRLGESPLVVTSAMAKVTDRLVDMLALAGAGQVAFAQRMVEGLRERHLQCLRELTLGRSAADGRRDPVATEQSGSEPPPARTPGERASDSAAEAIEKLCGQLRDLLGGIAALGEATPRARDAVLSFGERLSPPLLAVALANAGVPMELADARRIVVTDEDFTRAQPLPSETNARVEQELRPLVSSGIVPVMGGFIGGTRRGVVTTLGRGGSDFSAAVIGAALGCDRIEIWTDVDGMLTADPRVCSGTRRIKALSFQEAAELAYFGAKVLHPATILPAVQKNIPVWILNSRSWRPGPPDGERTGTLITTRGPRASAPFKGISCKRRMAVIDVVSTRMLAAHGFLKAIFDVFADHGCPVDMVSTSEVSVSLTVADLASLPEIADELGRFAEVRYEGRKAIVCLVGEGIRDEPGLAGAVFGCLQGINVRMISQGASEINIGFVIEDDDVPEAMRRLHERFFASADAAIFG